MLFGLVQRRWLSQDAIPRSQPIEASYSAAIIQANDKLCSSSNFKLVFCKSDQICVSRASVEYTTC